MVGQGGGAGRGRASPLSWSTESGGPRDGAGRKLTRSVEGGARRPGPRGREQNARASLLPVGCRPARHGGHAPVEVRSGGRSPVMGGAGGTWRAGAFNAPFAAAAAATIVSSVVGVSGAVAVAPAVAFPARAAARVVNSLRFTAAGRVRRGSRGGGPRQVLSVRSSGGGKPCRGCRSMDGRSGGVRVPGSSWLKRNGLEGVRPVAAAGSRFAEALITRGEEGKNSVKVGAGDRDRFRSVRRGVDAIGDAIIDVDEAVVRVLQPGEGGVEDASLEDGAVLGGEAVEKFTKHSEGLRENAWVAQARREVKPLEASAAVEEPGNDRRGKRRLTTIHGSPSAFTLSTRRACPADSKVSLPAPAIGLLPGCSSGTSRSSSYAASLASKKLCRATQASCTDADRPACA